jgi:hypothetical protein
MQLKGHSLFGDTSSCNAYQKPKLPIFSGEEKSETSFDVWNLEVKCVLREGNYTDSSVLQAIRGSLKGKARSLLLSLSEHATAENIIDKLDGVYGNVYSSEALLENFFKKTQQPNQSVAEYGMKLESIIQSAVEKGDIIIVAKNQMLKSKFWSGLRDPLLKNSSRYKFDTTKDFDQLRKEIRAIELELANSDKGITTVQHQHILKKLDEILKKIDRMGKRLDTLVRSENAPEKETSNTQFNGGHRGGNRYNPKRYGRVGGYQNHRGHGDKNSSNQDQSKTDDKKKSEGNLN